MVFGITVTGNVQQRLNVLTKFKNVTPEIVKAGVNTAKRFAPGKYSAINPGKAKKSTGALQRAIYGKYSGKTAGVYVKVPLNLDGRMRPYHLWMNGRGRYPQVMTGKTKPKSGSVYFMQRALNTMKRLARIRFQQNLRKKIR